LTDETIINGIMALHGSDVEKHKTEVATATESAKALQAQLTEANKAIESFKALKPEELQKAADDWKAKAEQATKDAADQVSKLKFDHALESALTGAKVKDVVSVKAHLKTDALKLNEDGSILGLKEQLETLKTSKDFLFNSDTPTPQFITGGNNQSILGDKTVAAMRAAAGLPEKQG
jgi:predicted phage tail protein